MPAEATVGSGTLHSRGGSKTRRLTTGERSAMSGILKRANSGLLHTSQPEGRPNTTKPFSPKAEPNSGETILGLSCILRLLFRRKIMLRSGACIYQTARGRSENLN